MKQKVIEAVNILQKFCDAHKSCRDDCLMHFNGKCLIDRVLLRAITIKERLKNEDETRTNAE